MDERDFTRTDWAEKAIAEPGRTCIVEEGASAEWVGFSKELDLHMVRYQRKSESGGSICPDGGLLFIHQNWWKRMPPKGERREQMCEAEQVRQAEIDRLLKEAE